jgi:nucleoside 2-deoxyribosyltransferase
MVSFLKKRLQIFVSSTYIDLREERQAAVEAILTSGHIPAGMELFTAGDESQMEVIKQWIDESDVYLLILGGRYGSIEPNSGKSYTHIEYEYAAALNKPLFSCVIEEDALDERVKKDGRKILEQDNPQKLKEFRSFVSSKMVRFWSDSKDIKLTILETLPIFSRQEDLIGWVRPTDQVDAPALADEIARLSKENANLRHKLMQFRESDTALISGISYQEMKSLLEKEISESAKLLFTKKHSSLLDFLLEHRFDFTHGVYQASNDSERLDCQTLKLRGLLIMIIEKDRIMSYHRWNITDDCRIFLNKFDLEKSSNQT